MYKCEICGRKTFKKISYKGYILCSKHMHQLHKHGKFLDDNPRTQKDLNEFRIKDNIVEFDVYDINNNVNGHFIIDKKDLQKIRYHKWRKDTNQRIITGNCSNKNPRRELSRFLLDITDENLIVDHINGNTLDNRRNNLRVCTQKENTYNKSFMKLNTSEFIGVSFDKSRYKWNAEIRKEYIRCHLGRYSTKAEAVYARYIAEQLLFEEYRNLNSDEKKQQLFLELSNDRKIEIEINVFLKVSKKYNINL